MPQKDLTIPFAKNFMEFKILNRKTLQLISQAEIEIQKV